MKEDKDKSSMNTREDGQGLIVTRMFDAPRDIVWKAWTRPEEVKQWWGPRGFTSPSVSIDLRTGGSYLFDMRSPQGQDFWSTGVYREIKPLEKIVATDSFADENGKVVPASYYGMSGEWPLEMPVTFLFEDQGSKTKLTLKYPDIQGISATDRENMRQGWNESLDKLAEHVERTRH